MFWKSPRCPNLLKLSLIEDQTRHIKAFYASIMSYVGKLIDDIAEVLKKVDGSSVDRDEAIKGATNDIIIYMDVELEKRVAAIRKEVQQVLNQQSNAM